MHHENRMKLKRAYYEWHRKKYPSIPDHARPEPSYKDDTANDLTDRIVDYVKYTGGFAEIIIRMGRKIIKDGKEIWISGRGRNGTADISVILPGGMSARVEVKFGRDRISPDQSIYRDAVTAVGAFHMFAHSFDEFVGWYEEILNLMK